MFIGFILNNQYSIIILSNLVNIRNSLSQINLKIADQCGGEQGILHMHDVISIKIKLHFERFQFSK